jgi:hypothetical protein
MMDPSLSKPKSRISKWTVGKIQRKPIVDVLRFDRVLLENASPDEVLRLIRESKDFENWVRDALLPGGKGEKLIEAAQREDRTYLEGGRRVRLSPSDVRTVLFHLFSANQRGGGSRISAYPLIEVDSKKYVGVESFYSAEKDILLERRDASHGPATEDMVRLSGYHIRIGRPYAQKLIQATSLLARGIDRVSANLSVEVARRRGCNEATGVEDVTVWCSEHLKKLLAVPNSGGRFIAKADFLLYPPPSLREKALKRGAVNRNLGIELRDTLQKGEFCLSVFDVSGGGAGVGLSEWVAQHWGFRSSGNLETYVDQLLHEYDRLNPEPPTQVLILPSARDFRNFGSVEYIPLWRAFRERGYRSYIGTSEMYQERLFENPEELRMRSVDDEDIVICGEERTLIVRRYMYLYDDRNEPGGTIPRHPPGTTVLPSDESRIVASDCRVNLPLLQHVTRSMRGSPGEDQLGPFQVIPFAILKLEDPNAAYAAQGFLASCTDQWPEVNYLGGVVKPVDKVPVPEGAVVPSAYPLPPVPTTQRVIDRMVKPLFDNLLEKGVREVVVMPNLLPFVVDQHHCVLPKFEIRMISLGT